MRRRDVATPRRSFDDFFRAVEPRLRQALVATYGAHDGREAAVDALSWAWEHWERLQTMHNPAGYLYRVGQSAVRRFASRRLPGARSVPDQVDPAEIHPELIATLSELSDQQRAVVVLVHVFGWRQSDVAELLELSPSTVHAHLQRGLERLRGLLEGVTDAC